MAMVSADPSSVPSIGTRAETPHSGKRASQSPDLDAEQAQPIRAYAKLEFPGFSYYIQTLEVTIGRRPQQPIGASPSWRSFNDVDVDLGPLKSISRLHARIYYTVQQFTATTYANIPQYMAGSINKSPSQSSDIADNGRFVLQVLGRNGAFVDDVWVSMNGIVPLNGRTKIQIAERVFYFVLPPPALGDDISDTEAIEGDTGFSESGTEEPLQKGKGKGKKRTAEDDTQDAKRQRSESEASTAIAIPGGSKRSKSKDGDTNTPQKTNEVDDSALAAPLTPVPAAEKPGLTNVELVTRALSSEFSRAKGGKLTLQEVYEWLQISYPWFSQNGRRNGIDWQSAIRHTIGSSREFVKIPRRPDEHGKGIFYALAPAHISPSPELARQQQPKKSVSPMAKPTEDTPQPRVSPMPTSKHKSLPRIPLVVGFSPNDATTESKPKGNAPGSIESLLERPPIAHHQGKLYLSPTVFGNLSAQQLQQIEDLGAQKALQVLQTYLVNHLKERMKRGGKGPAVTAGKAPPGTTGKTSAGAAGKSPNADTGQAPAAPLSIASAFSGKAPIISGKSPELDTTGKLPQAGDKAPSVIPPSLAAALAAAVKGQQQSSSAPASLPATARVPPSGGQSPEQGPTSSTPGTYPVPSGSLSASLPSNQRLSQPAVPRIPVPRTESNNPGSSTSSSIAPPSIPTGSKAEARPGSKSEQIGALSDLASHPEAAGLINLLKQQQSGSQSGAVKLTPGQVELLQLANKLAAMQKAQQGQPVKSSDNVSSRPASG